jgi:hypothetical protein
MCKIFPVTGFSAGNQDCKISRNGNYDYQQDGEYTHEERATHKKPIFHNYNF